MFAIIVLLFLMAIGFFLVISMVIGVVCAALYLVSRLLCKEENPRIIPVTATVISSEPIDENGN